MTRRYRTEFDATAFRGCTIDATLPEEAAVRNEENGRAVIVKRGERGFYELTNDIDPNAFNEARGVTAAQREAMKCGSMFGWDIPAARAATWSGRDVPQFI